MPKIANRQRSAAQSHRGFGARKVEPRNRARVRVSPGVATAPVLIAPAPLHRLPSLAAIPATYEHFTGDALLPETCKALVRAGIGGASDWEAAKGNLLTFVQKAFQSWLDANVPAGLDDVIGYDAEIATPGHWMDRLAEDESFVGPLVLSVDTSTCGFLTVGPTLAMIEEREPGLASAFYSVLCNALYEWVSPWDHEYVGMRLEMRREMLESDIESAENKTQRKELEAMLAETPDIATIVPPYALPSAWPERAAALALLQRHRTGPCARFIEPLLTAVEFTGSVASPECRIDRKAARYFDGEPLPSLAICFEEHDSLQEVIDDDLQHLYEYDHVPALMLAIDPAEEGSLEQAFQTFKAFLEFNRHLACLINAINSHYREIHPCKEQ